MNICIYGASSPDIDNSYFAPVEALGRAMAKRGFGLVFGGGAQGLMGAAVRGVIAEGGYSLGIAPEIFRQARYPPKGLQRVSLSGDHARAQAAHGGPCGCFHRAARRYRHV